MKLLSRFQPSVLLFIILFFLTSSLLYADTSIFNRNLSIGMSGTDVYNLQKILNRDSRTEVTETGAGSRGQETDYFGNLTHLAVIRYQELYKSEILTPANLPSGTGFVGNLTRNKLNTVTKVTKPPAEPILPAQTRAKPVITSVSPLHAMEGTEITLTGTGFAPTNTVYASFNKLENIPSLDGKTIKFIVQEPFPDDLFVPDFIREDFKKIDYGFYIQNQNGYSNTVMFVLDLIPTK